MDRYIDHIREGVFDAAPFPMTFDPFFYADKNILPLRRNSTQDPLDLIHMISGLEKGLFQEKNSDKNASPLPTKNLYWNVDTEKIKENHIVPQYLEHLILEKLEWQLYEFNSILMKGDLAFLSMLVANNWNRPICIGLTARAENFLGLNNYFHLEGMVYRLYPVEHQQSKSYIHLHGGVNANETYKKIISDFIWDGIDDIEGGKKAYLSTYSKVFQELNKVLISQGETQKAKTVLDLYFKVFSNYEKIETYYTTTLIKQYFQLGYAQEAEEIGLRIIDFYSKKKSLSIKDKGKLRLLPLDKSKVLSDAFEKIGW